MRPEDDALVIGIAAGDAMGEDGMIRVRGLRLRLDRANALRKKNASTDDPFY
ncbi:MAG: hypothetical protein AAFY56_14685 [Pseudomonadota bacterium]